MKRWIFKPLFDLKKLITELKIVVLEFPLSSGRGLKKVIEEFMTKTKNYHKIID